MPFLPKGRVYDPQRLSVITTIAVPVRIPCHYYFQDLCVLYIFFVSVCWLCLVYKVYEKLTPQSNIKNKFSLYSTGL